MTDREFDVVVLGGGLVGSMAAIMFARRGFRTLVLESRPEGKEQKVVVGEAITEGSSLFLRHEIGLTDWLKDNAFRKFGFDFLTLPRDGKKAETLEDCHELLLSTAPLEKVPQAIKRLIPTFHVERTGMNAHVAKMAMQAGAVYKRGATVENVELDEAGMKHVVHYSEDGEKKAVSCRFVVDASGRRTILGRQLGITKPVESFRTASVWNRFEGVCDDKAVWSSFHGIDRRRQTIHMTGEGFWIWWIHQNEKLTSVGISYDTDMHKPNLKTEDKGFWEMMAKFPPVMKLLEGAKPLEPYQYYGHLAYQSEHWLGNAGYAILGDAAWFTDALYSIGIETSCRQLMNLVPLVEARIRDGRDISREVEGYNQEFAMCQKSVLELNRFKYKEAWHRPYVLMQSAMYELGEIAELYHMQPQEQWTEENRSKYYRLQWYKRMRYDNLVKFLEGCMADADRDLEPGAALLKKALVPGKIIYHATWPFWNVKGASPYFFAIIRGWAQSERMAQRKRWWPDFLAMMATAHDSVPDTMKAIFPKIAGPVAPAYPPTKFGGSHDASM